MTSTGTGAVRLAFAISIACAMVFVWETQPKVFDGVSTSNNFELIEKQEARMAEMTVKINNLQAERGKINPSVQASIKELLKRQTEDKQNAKELEKAMRDFFDYSQSRFKVVEDSVAVLIEKIGTLESALESVGTSDPVVTPRSLKVHLWDDSTHKAPREDLLVAEGWTEYNGLELGHKEDSSTAPWFVKTDDPEEADLIVWISVMAIHEAEIPPDDPTKHLHKVIVLDYADGCTVHKKLDHIRKMKTEIAYFKRSFVHRGQMNSYGGNCTNTRNVRPYAYCGAKVMMIPMRSEGADVNYDVIRPDEGSVYGKVYLATNINKQPEDGYFKDPRYENFLVPFQDRKWTVTNVLRHRDESPNKARNQVVEWTHEFSKELVGDAREEKSVRDGEKDVVENNDGYTAFIGEVNNFCTGYCFGMNYLRHLRDAKIVVTCNPGGWEGDFRMWEAFLSGAMVMVDKTMTLGFMPNPPQNGVHFITYDPSKKDDFMGKLRYFTDPANMAETEKIAKAGYEFVLRNHMAVNRVGYVLDQVRDQLSEYIEDPSKRATLRLPPK